MLRTSEQNKPQRNELWFIQEFQKHGLELRQAAEADRIKLRQFHLANLAVEMVKSEDEIEAFEKFTKVATPYFFNAKLFAKQYFAIIVDAKQKIVGCLGFDELDQEDEDHLANKFQKSKGCFVKTAKPHSLSVAPELRGSKFA